MPNKKDEEYYKKLYKKLKKQESDDVYQMKRTISWYRNMMIALCKRNKGQMIKITKSELASIKLEDELGHELKDNGSFIFYLKDGENSFMTISKGRNDETVH